MFLGPGDVGERMLYVTWAFGAEFYFVLKTGELFQNSKSFLKVDAAAGCNVKDSTRNLLTGRFAGEKVRTDGVVYIREIAALFAVTKDRGLLASQHLNDELRQNSRIRRRGILARPEDIEVPQRDGLQSIAAEK